MRGTRANTQLVPEAKAATVSSSYLGRAVTSVQRKREMHLLILHTEGLVFAVIMIKWGGLHGLRLEES